MSDISNLRSDDEEQLTWPRVPEDMVLTYVIEMVGFDLVKIGKTKGLLSRLSTLQNGNPFELRVIARLRGDVEGLLHGRLAEHRVRGEWFKFVPEVTRLIGLLDKAHREACP